MLKKTVSLFACLILLGFACLAGSNSNDLPGTILTLEQMQEFHGESLPGTKCIHGNACTHGSNVTCTPPVGGACGGEICAQCTGGSRQLCTFDTTGVFCMQAPNQTCCTPNICVFVPPTILNPLGQCTCTGIGVAGGLRTVC